MSETVLNRIKALISMRPRQGAFRSLSSFQRGRAAAFKEIADIIDCINPENVNPTKFNEGEIVYELNVTGQTCPNPDGTIGTRLIDPNGTFDGRFRAMKFIPIDPVHKDVAGNFKIIIKKLKDEDIKDRYKLADLKDDEKCNKKAIDWFDELYAGPVNDAPVIEEDPNNEVQYVKPQRPKRKLVVGGLDMVQYYNDVMAARERHNL